MKKLTAMLLALIMVLSMAVTALAEDPRNITIGLWWDIYYDSNDESWEDNEAATGKETDLMRFDNVKNIEDTYGVTYEFQTLTYAGVQDSVNNSILAGEPDCDVYMVELGWGVPAVMNGYALHKARERIYLSRSALNTADGSITVTQRKCDCKCMVLITRGSRDPMRFVSYIIRHSVEFRNDQAVFRKCQAGDIDFSARVFCKELIYHPDCLTIACRQNIFQVIDVDARILVTCNKKIIIVYRKTTCMRRKAVAFAVA